ncbi:MAG TPA: gliding motility-associated C-terminal domain-containing protein, partial [Niastella sp.]|nr:gliding motility-associated C-terminal domain-containing protein [Niastella sp.]
PVRLEGTYPPNIKGYTWRPVTGLSCTDCPFPFAGPKFNTQYIVEYVDSNNCKNSTMVQVIVLCKNANVFIPNTFSPNGDGSNDVFYVRGRGLDRVKSLRIFDRWGEVVFEKKDFPVNDPSVGWDGRFKGARPKSDVYVYQVEVFCDNGDLILFDGNVALIQ